MYYAGRAIQRDTSGSRRQAEKLARRDFDFRIARAFEDKWARHTSCQHVSTKLREDQLNKSPRWVDVAEYCFQQAVNEVDPLWRTILASKYVPWNLRLMGQEKRFLD